MLLAKRVVRAIFRLVLLLGTAAYFIWIFPPPTLCPGGDEPRSIGRWEESMPMPTARSELAAALEGKLYALDGRTGDLGNLASMEVYNPETNSWEGTPAMPTAWGSITAGTILDTVLDKN